MIELLRYEFERLRTDEEFNLYRGRRTAEPSCERPDDVEPSSILVLSPILQQPEAGTIKQLWTLPRKLSSARSQPS